MKESCKTRPRVEEFATSSGPSTTHRNDAISSEGTDVRNTEKFKEFKKLYVIFIFV